MVICKPGFTGEAGSDGNVIVLIRNRSSEASAACKLPKACCSCSSRIFASSRSFAPFSSAATSIKRSDIVFKVAAISSGFWPLRLSRRKLLARSSLMSSVRISSFEASRGLPTLKSIRRPAHSSRAVGAQANPSSSPIESPGSPRSKNSPREDASVKASPD